MVQTLKIKARIVELGLSQNDIVESLKEAGVKMAYSTFNQKINNVRTLSLTESLALQQILHIPDEDFKNYFFQRPNLK